ncbi:MAG TPA: ATP-dependent DNA helicase RecG [Anaerolineae bacterium]|nr:ATP-dependent DNA helicase RecG [Anaerolineae bacterium]
MINPLDTLKKRLLLEQKDYAFQDKAVAGGLVRYADTWRRQALAAFGDAAWVEDVAVRLCAYSGLQPEARQQALQELWAILSAPPAPVTSDGAPAEVSAPTAPPASSAARPAPSPAQPGRGILAPVTTLPGVAQKRAAYLEKLGVRTIADLLHYYPRRYEDYSQLKTIDHLEYGELVTVIATVWEAGGREVRPGLYLFRAIVGDGTGTLEVTWFNNRFLEGRLKAGMQIELRGRVGEHLGRLTMASPEWGPVGRNDLEEGRIASVYSLPEGLTQRWFRQLLQRTLTAWAGRLSDPLPEDLRQRYGLLPLSRALWGIHRPDDRAHLEAAQRRLAFEELLYLQLGLLRQKRLWKSQPGQPVQIAEDTLAAYVAALPYELTGAQRRSLEEMVRDIASPEPMNRLLQGDVGSGKTVLAALLMALTAAGGFQAALMAPTEVLAEQHFKSLSRLFERFPEPRPTLRLLTGSTGGAARSEIYAGLADGTLPLVVGTHALIQEQVNFHNLALVIIDEQHRFGVEQRGALRQKGYNPHLLVMTATPIPRSLELTLWGHLDVSVLDEMPPGRQPIETRVLTARQREAAYGFIRHQVAQGRQAFIIYPLVEESEKIEARAAVVEYERLQQEVFPDLHLGLLHGRMRSDEKDEVMLRFVRGELDILVATSVIEVGIDVPNATVILIDGAERFGLAQLHQFRGRVGRGEYPSYCLLLSESPSEEADERLKILETTTDGFVLAQKDLELRGPGQFLGTQQSGMPELPLAMQADTRWLHQAREAAVQLLAEDPELAEPAHQELAQRVAAFWQGTGDVS